MQKTKVSIFFIIIIISTLRCYPKAAGVAAVEQIAVEAKIIIKENLPVLVSTSTEWAETLLIISERTGVSIDKMTVIVDKLGTGVLYVAAAGVTIYSIKLVCNAGCSIKSTFWPSEEEVQAKLAHCVELDKRIKLAREEIKMLDAKSEFEQCLDRHIAESGFPLACENLAKAYAKFERYNEVNNIKAFFNQSKVQVC